MPFPHLEMAWVALRLSPPRRTHVLLRPDAQDLCLPWIRFVRSLDKDLASRRDVDEGDGVGRRDDGFGGNDFGSEAGDA